MGDKYRMCAGGRWLVLLLVAGLALASVGLCFGQESIPPLKSPQSGPQYLPNEAIVIMKQGSTAADVADLAKKVGAVKTKALSVQNAYRIVLPDVPGKIAVDQKLPSIASHPKVASAGRNNLRYPAAIPNDPLYPITTDNFGISYRDGQWALQPHFDQGALRNHIYAQPAWDLEKGRKNVVVAVIDTGAHVYPQYDDEGRVRRWPHPDLGSYKRVPSTLRYGRYQYVSDPLGRFIGGAGFTADYDDRGGPAPSDEEDDAGWSGHGTHVAGIIGAKTDNDHGVASLGWENIWLLPLRVFPDGMGGAPESCIADAIMYCIGYRNTSAVPGQTLKVDVINMSLGGQAPSVIELSAIRQATRMGIVVVAASGNNWDYGPLPPTYPGAHEETICVTASDILDNITTWSQRGHSVDIAAPGSNILSTSWNWWSVNEEAIDAYYEPPADDEEIIVPVQPGPGEPQPYWWNATDIWGNGYTSMSGTSMAAPMVSAAAALLISRNVPGEDVRDILRETATPYGLGRPNNSYGWGLLNVYEALKKACIDVNIQSPAHGGIARTLRPKIRVDFRNAEKESIRIWINPVDTDGDGLPDNAPVMSGEDPNFDQYYYVLDEKAGKAYVLFEHELPQGSHKIRARAETSLLFETPPPEPLIDDEEAIFKVQPLTMNAGWHLFSLPFAVDANTTPADLFTKPGVLARWHYGNSRYGEYAMHSIDGSRADAEASMRPPSVLDTYGRLNEKLVHPTGRPYEATPPAGLGYWLYVAEPISFPELSGIGVDSAPYEMCLYYGWNMVGNPFPFPIDWSTAVVEYAGNRVPASEAVANGWISDFVFKYDNVYRRYNWQRITGSATLSQWEGQWLQVKARGPNSWPEPDVKLIIPPSPYTGVLR